MATNLAPIGMISNKFDPDAQAYINAVITAGGSLTTARKNAINNKVINLKGHGPQNNTVNFWSRMVYCFLYMGGVKNAMAIELKSRASGTFFATGWTYGTNGALADGANAYMDTKFRVSTNFSNNSMTLCEDIGNNFASGSKSLHGLVDGTKGTILLINDGSNVSWFGTSQNGADGQATTTQSNTIGYWSHRQNGSTLTMEKNGSVIATNTIAPLALLNANLYIAANNFTGGGPTWYCDGLFRCSEAFNYCSDSEMAILSSINTAFQSAAR